jgi:aspartate racemase
MRAERVKPRLSPIEPLPRNGRLPTSSGQELTLAIAKKEGRFSCYCRLLRLTGHLDVVAMERALSEIIRRHEILRTTFETIDGESLQIVHPPQPWKLASVDLSRLPRAEREAKVMEMADIQMQEPFDVARGPLFRTTLVKLGEDEHALLYTILHIVCDMLSLSILRNEMAALYKAFSRGLPSTLPDLPIQYGDFAVWERRWLNNGGRKVESSFWRRELEGAPTVLRLSTDRPRPPVQTFRGATQDILLPDGLHMSVKSLCRRESVTMYMAFLAAFNVLLNRYTGQEDILVGTATSGRLKAEVENLIGQFINLLVMRTKLHGDPTFRELLSRVRETALKAYVHQIMPIWAIVQEFAPDPDPSYPTLVQIGFALRHDDEPFSESEGIESSLVSIEAGRAPFDLLLRIDESPDELRAQITYNVDLFERATIDRMLGNFQTLLERIVEDVGCRLSELPIFDEDSRKQLTV